MLTCTLEHTCTLVHTHTHMHMHPLPQTQVAAASTGRNGGRPRQRHVTSLAYDHTGHRLLASYTNDSIYAFRCGGMAGPFFLGFA